MSADATPITPTAFAAALKDLSLSSLHLKVLELRNSIAHLDYSNSELRPFALGLATALNSTPSQPDPDCVDAIRENEAVIERMQERIRIVRAEVEGRGFSWTEFSSKEEIEGEVGGEPGEKSVNGIEVNGTGANGHTEGGDGERHSAWTDGTFQTGRISGGQVQMDAVPGARQGGSLTDEELRRRMEEQLRGLGGEEEDEGVHL